MPNDTFTCAQCGELCPAEERTVFDGQALCAYCLSAHTATCTHCGTRIWISDNAGTEDMPLCQNCYDDHYVSCVECGALLHREDAYHWYPKEDDDDER